MPLKVVESDGTSERSVTGIEVSTAKAGTLAELCTMIEPAWSPGCDGVATVSVKLPEAPPASFSELGDTVPKRCQVAVLAWNRAGTAGPDPSVEISAVHLPGAGLATWASPKLPMPCGRLYSARSPLGAIRLRLTSPTSETDAFSRACPAGTVKVTAAS